MITPTQNIPDIKGDTAFVRIASLFKTYKNTSLPVKFFAQTSDGEITAYISKCDGVVNLFTTEKADFEELKYFIFRLGGKLFCEYKTLSLLSPGLPSVCGDILIFKGKAEKEFEEFSSSPDIRSIYDALKNDFSLPDFESFYADIFYRRKAKNIHFSSLIKDGLTVSNALTVAENENEAIIGGVYTNEDFRHLGFGLKAVLSLCERLKNKTIYVLTKDPSVNDFYKKAGFEKYGIWTETEINYE